MAAAPVTGKEASDLRLTKNELKTPKSVEVNLTIVQLSTSKTSPPAPFTPSTPSSGKRKRLKPARYDVSSDGPKKKHSPSKPKVVHDPSQTPVERSPVMIRAGEIQSSLGTEYPSFVKTMVRSHVSSCFWMGLPMPFCKSFLPTNDASMVVEDEKGQMSNLKYIGYKFGLSAGWRGFALSHKLLEGDVLIFQLVESCKFKVYIVRANDLTEDGLKEVDGTPNVLNDNIHTKPTRPETTIPYPKEAKSLTLTTTRKKHKRSTPATQPVDPTTKQIGPDVLESSPKPDLLFKEVNSFKDFHITVNGQCIDSELSEDMKKNYYKLCLDKKEFLHNCLPESLYYKLVAGMIGETVSIANEIKNCKITTTKEEFEALDNSLKSFEILGMKVGFLRDRIRILGNLVFESEDIKRYVDAKEEQKRAELAINILEAKLVELKESKQKFCVCVGGLKEKTERLVIEFLEKVDEPW